jgi:hypothetical protein
MSSSSIKTRGRESESSIFCQPQKDVEDRDKARRTHDQFEMQSWRTPNS